MVDTHAATVDARHGKSSTPTIAKAAAWVWEALVTWQERAGQRAHLAALSDRMLEDVGLTRADVQIEISKPFWKV